MSQYALPINYEQHEIFCHAHYICNAPEIINFSYMPHVYVTTMSIIWITEGGI